MALRAIFAPPPSKCYANCEKLDYASLIVTKCKHVYCKICLEDCFRAGGKTCPLHPADLIPPITDDNVRHKEEDTLNQDVQYTSFKLYLERFTYCIQNDFQTLKTKLAAEKIMKTWTCKLLKEENSKQKTGQKEFDQCSICNESFQMYFITQDKDKTRIGRFMHEECWQETVDDETVLLEISAPDMVKVAEQLPPKPTKPMKPISPITIFIVTIILPMSIWALAMNTRVYHNKSPFLFVLSIPALIIFKILSLFVNGIRIILTEKRT
ncbi:MAG TPA: RING finger protein [Rhabdochlamydiaceae bacterium]|jgi:hypothetical protein|nr:RING finger protein [Rhabdochlamydiaceae bacterium]